jgi:hypothetical protein
MSVLKNISTSLLFSSKAYSNSYEPNLEWSTWKVINSDRLLALSADIRLGWKGLPGTNNPAYYENS